MRRSVLVASVMVAAALTLSSCFTSTADFKNDAEKFILEDEGLTEALETTFTTADCEEPLDQNAGTTFTCEAEDSSGETWEFEITIQESNEYEVNISRRP